ncbi:phage tail fiber protein [Citrobacter freundii]|uniref:phage tail fiber protein n=1 Tax=Citrobacter freundii TaxID=546 RepID=UPI00292CA555|nr:phage tail protein [Citrobacter freundii]MDV1744563.1 phage tail protein [Citrobacter freundii]MEB0442342.1 phage tail protein [Citrobacter freundii]
MSAGTLTLTNNSAAVAGNGTAFTTEVAAGDFIVVTVGGVPYTLPVKSVESSAALTLVSNFTGPTQSGAAWSAVPRVALNMVTSALVAQSAEALRGLNYDKQNWQQVFSGAGNVTVRLPDGATFTGSSWGYLAANMLDKSKNLSDVDDLSATRVNLQVDRLGQHIGETYLYSQNKSHYVLVQDGGLWGVYRGTGTPGWKALGVGQGGTGSNTEDGARQNLYSASAQHGFAVGQYGGANNRTLTGSTRPPTAGVFFASGSSWTGTDYGALIVATNYGDTILPSEPGAWHNFLQLGNDGNLYYRMEVNANQSTWRKQYSTGNTTVDGNGNIKPASPVVKIRGDGSAELNEEAEGVTCERLGTGIYKISGVLGFNSEPIWGGAEGGFTIPHNGNGLPLLWVDFRVDEYGDITVHTYHREHANAPEFAKNVIKGVADGDPVDIPTGRWIDLRVEMPQNSIWNQKQKDMLEAMEKAECERQQNQQDAQV